MADEDGKQYINTTEQFSAFTWTTCQLCPQKFLNKEDFREHIIISHPRTPRLVPLCQIVCDFCSSPFPDNLRLFRHQESAHFTSMKNVLKIEFRCTLCNQEFVDLTSFEDHATEERHTSWIFAQLTVCRMFSCRFCEKKFSNFVLFKSHQRIQHRVVPKEEEGGKLTYNTKKPNRMGRLDFYSARPRGRPPKVRVDEEPECSMPVFREHVESEKVNVTTVEEEIEGFGCPFCSFFDEDYVKVSQHTSDHYQTIVARQQEHVEEEAPEDQVIELNSEVVTFMGRDRSFFENDVQEWTDSC